MGLFHAFSSKEKDKRRSRLVEWGKNLLILLLALLALYQLARSQGWLFHLHSLPVGGPSASASPVLNQSASAAVHPVRLAVCQNGQRYGVQYDQDSVENAFSTLSTLLSEALGSAGKPEAVSEEDWRTALRGTGIYVDFLYSIPLSTLSAWLGNGQENAALTGSARRLCLAAGEDGKVLLYYINESDSSYYACGTTLSRTLHLDDAVSRWSPNGALFAFETSGMESLAPYTLLTTTPQNAVYAAGNPLLEDSARVAQLLEVLSFHTQGAALDPAAGGQAVEGGDSLRLTRNGLVTFHAIDSPNSRLSLPDSSVQGALDYVQALAESTVGAWCGPAQLCLADVEENSDELLITFQYSLGGCPVVLPDGRAAAHFVVRGGAVTDFYLYLRAYSATREISPVLPEPQAAAAMDALGAQGKELTLLYSDSGGEWVRVGWAAV